MELLAKIVAVLYYRAVCYGRQLRTFPRDILEEAEWIKYKTENEIK
jgi:hypothetical protein